MSDPTDSSPTGAVFDGRMAMGLAASLLIGLAGIAVLGIASRSRVAALEHFEEVTAAGDFVYLKIPEVAAKPPAAAATWNGQQLFPVSYKKLDLRDTKMIRTGRDSASGLTIYRSRMPVPAQEGEREKDGEPFYFLKIAPNEFVKVRPWTPGL